MPAPQFELLWSGLTRPQTHDRAVSLLRAANSREQVVKMANEYIYPMNGASLAEFRERSGQAALASFRGPEPRAIFPASRARHAAHSAERLTYRMTCPCCRKATEQAIASLTTNYYLPVSLQAVVTGWISEALIKKLADQCADLDAFLAERNEFA